MSFSAAAFKLGRKLRKRIWPEDACLRKRFVNIGHLLGGNVVTSLVGVLSFILSARALGPADYGVLALTYTYARAVGTFIGFQSWQPLIKYGAALTGPEHVDDFRSLVKFGFAVDILAAVLSFAVAVALVLVLGPLVGVGPEATLYVLIYALVLLFDIKGVPTAIMRLSGKFKLVAYGSSVNGAVRAVFCAAGFFADAGLLYFVVVWTLTQITGSIALIWLSFRELRRQDVVRIASAPLKGLRKRFDGIMSFTIGGNLERTVRATANEFDTLLVGAFADTSAAGLYHIAKRFARVFLQIGVHVQAVFYPDVARLWAARTFEKFREAVFYMEGVLAAFGIVCILATLIGADLFISVTAGPEFAGAALLIKIQMVAVALNLTGSSVRTGLLAMGKQLAVLKVIIVSALAFHAAALSLIPHYGAMGANIAHIVMSLAWLAGLALAFYSSRQEPQVGAVSGPAE